MTRGRDVEECRIAAALYAIGALSPLESAHFEERLRSGCPLCMAEFAAYASVADELAMVIPAQSPAPSLRRRLFDRIQAAPKVLPSGQDMILVRSGDTSWVSLPVPGIEVRPLLGAKYRAGQNAAWRHLSFARASADRAMLCTRRKCDRPRGRNRLRGRFRLHACRQHTRTDSHGNGLPVSPGLYGINFQIRHIGRGSQNPIVFIKRRG